MHDENLDLQAPWTSLTYAVVDVEGNGQQPPDLVELAVVPITAGEIGQPTAWLVRPPRPILPLVRRFHHISDQDVAACPPVSEVADDLRAQLGGAVFVAHNAHVDLGVLSRELPGFAPTHIVDTLKLARRVLPDMKSYRLGELVPTLGLANGVPAELAPHRATYDALVCARLLVRLASPTGAPVLTVGDLLGEVRRRPKGGDGDDAAPALF